MKISINKLLNCLCIVAVLLRARAAKRLCGLCAELSVRQAREAILRLCGVVGNRLDYESRSGLPGHTSVRRRVHSRVLYLLLSHFPSLYVGQKIIWWWLGNFRSLAYVCSIISHLLSHVRKMIDTRKNIPAAEERDDAASLAPPSTNVIIAINPPHALVDWRRAINSQIDKKILVCIYNMICKVRAMNFKLGAMSCV